MSWKGKPPLKIFNRVCKRCGSIYFTKKRYGSICQLCDRSRNGNNRRNEMNERH